MRRAAAAGLMICWVRWIGHAGLAVDRPAGAPDRDALDRALSLELDMLELDVGATADARLVLCHDSTLPSGRLLSLLDLAEVRREQPGLLTLDEAVEHIAGRVPLLLDVKGPACVSPLAAWLTAGQSGDHLAVCDDDPRTLAALRARAGRTPRWRTLPQVGSGPGHRRRRVVASLLRSRLPERLPQLVDQVGAAGLSVDHWSVTTALCRAAHQLGLPVAAWTVNRGGRARAMARKGVDLITTDQVSAMRSAVGGNPSERPVGVSSTR